MVEKNHISRANVYIYQRHLSFANQILCFLRFRRGSVQLLNGSTDGNIIQAALHNLQSLIDDTIAILLVVWTRIEHDGN